MISTKNVAEQTNGGRISKYLGIGNHQLKINSIDVQSSSDKQSTKFTFNVETLPPNDANFTPVEGAEGQVGRIVTMFVKTDPQIEELAALMATLASKMGLRAAMDAIEANNITEFMEKACDIVRGNWFFGRVVGEEYKNQEGKVKVKLKWSRYGTFASIEEGIGKLKPVDDTVAYDLKRLAPETPATTVF